MLSLYYSGELTSPLKALYLIFADGDGLHGITERLFVVVHDVGFILEEKERNPLSGEVKQIPRAALLNLVHATTHENFPTGVYKKLLGRKEK
jgi:hypothetical protein